MVETSKQVLVTGANGFVGSHLVQALLARGYRVRCMVRRSSNLAFIRDLPVEWAYADISDPESLQRSCQDVQAVCHCAALTRALREDTFFAVNTQGTVAMAQACLEANPGLERFIFVSSQAAAGQSPAADDYIDESAVPKPVTWYGQSKLAAEEALRSLGTGFPLTIVRPSAVFGPRDRDFLSYFSLVQRGFSLSVGRNGHYVSLIYVRDLVDMILCALESPTAVGQTYFACGQAVSYAGLSAAIARALDRRTLRISVPKVLLGPMALCTAGLGRLLRRPLLLNEQRIRDLRQPYWLCSGEKARRELGFVASFELDAAIKETASWYLENGWL